MVDVYKVLRTLIPDPFSPELISSHSGTTSLKLKIGSRSLTIGSRFSSEASARADEGQLSRIVFYGFCLNAGARCRVGQKVLGTLWRYQDARTGSGRSRNPHGRLVTDGAPIFTNEDAERQPKLLGLTILHLLVQRAARAEPEPEQRGAWAATYTRTFKFRISQLRKYDRQGQEP